ncbi:MAG: FMN-binding protein [Eubacterium sp.]|nr:FMN-binding protein [Eubacterium sp.]
MKEFRIKVIGLIAVCLALFIYQAAVKSDLPFIESMKEALEGGLIKERSLYKDGTYEGKGEGFKGEMTVAVTVSGGKISAIEIIDTGDGKVYCTRALAAADEIIEKQSTEDVDAVSGATYSSNGLIEAVKDALGEAEN